MYLYVVSPLVVKFLNDINKLFKRSGDYPGVTVLLVEQKGHHGIPTNERLAWDSSLLQTILSAISREREDFLVGLNTYHLGVFKIAF